MSPLIPTRRVEEFANAADGHAPARRADVRELVELVGAVRAVGAPPPRSEFVAQLRSELMALAPDALSQQPRQAAPARPVRRPQLVHVIGRRFAVAAAAFVVTGGGVGLVATSAAALPGEMLYPVKRAGERVDLLLHTDPGDDARILLEHAQTRLDEVAGLLASEEDLTGRNRLVTETLADFPSDAVRGGKILLDSYRRTGSAADIEDLRSFTITAASQLQALAPALPPSSSDAYADAAAAVGALDLEAVTACPTCGSGTPPVQPLSAAVETTRRLIGDTTDPSGRALPDKHNVAQPKAERTLERSSDDADPGRREAPRSPDRPAAPAAPAAPADPGVPQTQPELPPVDATPTASPDNPAPPVAPPGDNPIEAVTNLVGGGGTSSETGEEDGSVPGGDASVPGADQPGPADDPTNVVETPDLPLP